MVNILKHILIFLAGFLAFQIQLISAKEMLPIFGGSASIWLGNLLFFQIALYFSYFLLDSFVLTPIKFTLLAAFNCFIYFLLYNNQMNFEYPLVSLIVKLATGPGLIYVTLLMISPLIQKKSVETNPYRFYATSNLGAFIGLFSYPFFFELILNLDQQKFLFHILSAITIIVSITFLLESKVNLPETNNNLKYNTNLKVIILSIINTWLLGSFSNYLIQDIAGFPLIWVLPLSIFLLAFVWVFSGKPMGESVLIKIYNIRIGLIQFLFIALASGYVSAISLHYKYIVLIFILLMSFLFYIINNIKIQKESPEPSLLTKFYLEIALGGALGGLIVNVFFPLLFPKLNDLQIVLLIMLVYELGISTKKNGIKKIELFSLITLLFIYIAISFLNNKNILYSSKNFYGTLRVYESSSKRVLYHGQINHGEQNLKNLTEPTIYYRSNTGLGKTFDIIKKEKSNLRIATIGLGIGVVASYGRESDFYDFYEIDPEVIMIANNYFSFLKDSPSHKEFFIGDGRQQLEKRKVSQYDLIIVDAFNGDSIPTHLLTRESLELYLSKLMDGGYLTIHISNNNMDLRPIIQEISNKLNQKVVFDYSHNENGENATWAIICKNKNIYENEQWKQNQKYLINPISNSNIFWKVIMKYNNSIYLWTDDYSNILSILK